MKHTVVKNLLSIKKFAQFKNKVLQRLTESTIQDKYFWLNRFIFCNKQKNIKSLCKNKIFKKNFFIALLSKKCQYLKIFYLPLQFV